MSSFGGMGGLLASQFGLEGANRDWMEITAKSHSLAELVIVRNDLLPKLYPELWDEQVRGWKVADSSEIPSLRDGIDLLRKSILKVSTDMKKNTLTIGINIQDSSLAAPFVEYYLQALNDYICENTQKDSDSNKAYLQGQLKVTADPILREKIQSLIAGETEKAMLVSTQAFKLLEKPVSPREKSKPDRKKIVMLSLVGGAFLSVLLLYLIYFVIGVRARLRTENSHS